APAQTPLRGELPAHGACRQRAQPARAGQARSAVDRVAIAGETRLPLGRDATIRRWSTGQPARAGVAGSEVRELGSGAVDGRAASGSAAAKTCDPAARRARRLADRGSPG